jgi:hypothetical protein
MTRDAMRKLYVPARVAAGIDPGPDQFGSNRAL